MLNVFKYKISKTFIYTHIHANICTCVKSQLWFVVQGVYEAAKNTQCES